MSVCQSEKEVKERIAEWLKQELHKEFDKVSVKSGEICVNTETRWYADVVASVPLRQEIAIECKCAGGDFRKAIGQARAYKYMGKYAGVAMPNMSQRQINIITASGLFCLNLNSDTVEMHGSLDPEVTSDQVTHLENRIRELEELVEGYKEHM